MTLREMEIFIEVAKWANMTKAAETLYVSQPTISQVIKKIESEYSLILFHRLGKQLFLSFEGEKLLQYTKEIVNLNISMNKSMHTFIQHPTIFIGSTITIGQSLLPSIISSFEKKNKNISVNAFIDNTLFIENLLMENKIDFAFIEGTVKNKDLISTPLYKDKLVLICHPSHELANNRSITLKQAAKYPFLVREEGSGTKALFQKELDKNNITITTKWIAHNFDSITNAILANQGVSVMSQLVVKELIENNKIVAIPFSDLQLERYFSLVIHKNKIPTNEENQLISMFEHYK